jgi:hypothetical protein
LVVDGFEWGLAGGGSSIEFAGSVFVGGHAAQWCGDGVGAYFRAHGVSELAFKDAAHHLVLAHGATNMTSQLTLLALGQQEALSGRAFMAGMAAGFVSHGMSGAFGSGSEGLVLLLETAVQGQVERLTGALIYQQGIFDLEAIGMSLLGVGVGFATQHMMQALGEHFGWVSASDTQVQESQGHQEEGAPYAPSPEDRVYEEGLLAGQGYAGGHEDAGENEPRRPGFYWQEESSPASDERRYTPDWLEERGMRLLPASDSRHGVQAMDGFALEDLTFDIPSLSPSSGQEGQSGTRMRAFGEKVYNAVAFLDAEAGKILNFVGRERVDKFIGFMDRHHPDIAFSLPMAAPAAAAAPALARGLTRAGSRFWDTVGPRVTSVGKLMLEKISPGVENGVSAAGSRFGFFAGRKGAPVASRVGSGAESNNPLIKVLQDAKPTPGKSNQLETTLSDGTKVIFRRDVGKHAHPIGKAYRDPVDHYNIEVHIPSVLKPGKYVPRENIHIILDKDLKPVKVIMKNNNSHNKQFMK